MNRGIKYMNQARRPHYDHNINILVKTILIVSIILLVGWLKK